MVKLNFDAYRFSISWSEFFQVMSLILTLHFPSFLSSPELYICQNGTGEVNWEGVSYYNKLINYLLKKGNRQFFANSELLFIVPWGMYKAITYVKKHYGHPKLIITENGMDDPGNVTLPNALEDMKRVNYFKDYLAQLKKAIDEGANV
ncbi:Glycoside hydrolase family 1, partial [Dillenia turbinata]